MHYRASQAVPYQLARSQRLAAQQAPLPSPHYAPAPAPECLLPKDVVPIRCQLFLSHQSRESCSASFVSFHCIEMSNITAKDGKTDRFRKMTDRDVKV